uniref:Uncharacterized protein n=1 Tax=Rhizophora mucronata TaxID=61149 RepID=A0A2P2LP51_RHIMU
MQTVQNQLIHVPRQLLSGRSIDKSGKSYKINLLVFVTQKWGKVLIALHEMLMTATY